MKQVVVVGSANYDIIVKVPSLPRMGETLTAESTVMRAGGKGANQAVQLAKLGIPTHFVGCIGNDGLGDKVKKELVGYGVRTELLRTVPGSTGMGIVQALPDGSVFATIERGANYKITKDDIDAAVPRIKESRHLILQLEIPYDIVCYAVETAKRYGIGVVLNAAPAGKLPQEIMGEVDYLAVNEVEAGFYLNEEIRDMETAMQLLPKFIKKWNNKMTVICTLGKKGAVICDAAGRQERIPPGGKEAVETTGAGDSFLGGFVYSLCEGKNNAEAGTFAARCSALTISRVGAQEAMPDLKDIKNKFGNLY